jgi:hypothetical protein
MIDEVLYGVVEEAIGVSHDGRRDPTLNGKPDYTPEDEVLEDLTGHGRKTVLMKVQNFHVTVAGHQKNRRIFPKWGLVGSRLEGGGHVGCARFDSCTGLKK